MASRRDYGSFSNADRLHSPGGGRPRHCVEGRGATGNTSERRKAAEEDKKNKERAVEVGLKRVHLREITGEGKAERGGKQAYRQGWGRDCSFTGGGRGALASGLRVLDRILGKEDTSWGLPYPEDQ